MIDFKLILAGKRISASVTYESTRDFCKDFIVDDFGESDITVNVTSELILAERNIQISENSEQMSEFYLSDKYLELLALYRQIVERMAEFDTVMFHGSAIAVDGVAYIFAALSGTGKSTHTRLWREYFGDRAVMVNDDKPLLTVRSDGTVTVHGTPWNGKHNLGNNISAPLKAISILNRGENNTAEAIDKKTAFGMLLQQTYRPDGVENMAMLLPLIDKLADNVKLFNIHCNLEESAAVEIHNAIGG